MSKSIPRLEISQETLVVQLLGEARDLSVLIAQHFHSPESSYLLQSFFLVLRQMGYFFTENSSPLIRYKTQLTAQDTSILETIKNIRDAIAHRDSPNNFLDNSIKIIGATNFKNDDAEIQYGQFSLLLLQEVYYINNKLRSLFMSADELSFLARQPRWAMDEGEIQEAETNLTNKLKNPEKLLGLDTTLQNTTK